MCQNEHEILAAQLADLLNGLAGKGPPEQELAITAWFRAVPGHLMRFAFDLVSIYKARDRIVVNTGTLISIIAENFDMSDKSTNVDTGGGDVVGSAIGSGASVIAQTIQNIKNNVGATGNFDAAGQKLFSSAADAIGADRSLDDEEKAAALYDLEKLGAEAAKANPKTSLLKRAWEGVKVIAGALPTVVELGKWLHGKFPSIPGP